MSWRVHNRHGGEAGARRLLIARDRGLRIPDGVTLGAVPGAAVVSYADR